MMITLDAVCIGDIAILERHVEVCPHHHLRSRVEVLGQEGKCGFLHFFLIDM
jgi:hypothetical protein